MSRYDNAPELGVNMRRRTFIAGRGAAALPLAARAQQLAKIPTVGFMLGGSAASQRTWADAFVQGLRQLGWIEGNTVAIEYRWAEGRSESTGEFVAEFVRRKVNVIVSGSTEGALAAKQATLAIPIVFSVAGDPVGTGLVTSLARPGGNVTGLSNFSVDLAAKLLELLGGHARAQAPGGLGQCQLFRRRAGTGRDQKRGRHARARVDPARNAARRRRRIRV